MFCLAIFTVKSFESNRNTLNNNNTVNATGDVFSFLFHSLSLTFGFWGRFMAIRIHFYGNTIRFELIYTRRRFIHFVRSTNVYSYGQPNVTHNFRLSEWCAMSVVVFDGQNTKNVFSFTYKLLTTVCVCRILPNFFFPFFSIFFFFNIRHKYSLRGKS